MGWIFPVEFANIVAFITTPEPQTPLLLSFRDVSEFLQALQHDLDGESRLISADPEWIPAVVKASQRGSQQLQSIADSLQDGPLPQSVIREVLNPLQRLLGDYNFFGLAVTMPNNYDRTTDFARAAAYRSGHHAIFLIPQIGSADSALQCLTPFRPISLLAEQPDSWPGILFWTRSGGAAFVSLKEAESVFKALVDASERGAPVNRSGEQLDRILNAAQPQRKSKAILHLSDLHFGSDVLSDRPSYLLTHLQSKLDSIDRIVITGDLFNNPRPGDAVAFNAFRDELRRSTKKDIIVIPGNHDSKFMGNSYRFMGRNLEQLAALEWRNIVVDDDIQCVFLCFDTSMNTDWATGRITSGQTMRIAIDFENECRSNPKLKQYHRIALIHHHPFSFEVAQHTLLQKVLGFFGYPDERFLEMLDAQQFVDWCAKREVPLILHGHKHVPKHITQKVEFDNGTQKISRVVTAIGCGTSLGAENYPMSYDILRWSPSNGCWSVSFWADDNKGSGFFPQLISVQTQNDWRDNFDVMKPIELKH